MDLQTRKLGIGDGMLSVKDEDMVEKVEALLGDYAKQVGTIPFIQDLVGTLDGPSADEMEKVIQTHCERTDDAGWQ